jgi:hypothetical protein
MNENLSSVNERMVQLLAKVRDMKPGGDLDSLILSELKDMEPLIYQAAVNERMESAASQAAFSPSGMPEMQTRKRRQRRKACAKNKNEKGRGSL